MRIPTDATPSVQQALGQIWQEIQRLEQRDVNMKGRRIVNAATGVQGSDYVTRSQLREYVQSQQFAQDVQIVIPSGGGGGGGTSAAHQLLSPTHIDTNPAAPTRGDVIVANSVPLWARLAKGAANTFLRSDGTDVGYQAVGWLDDATDITATASRTLKFPITANGAGLVFGHNSENITITGANTDSSANLLPANSVILYLAGRVTTNLIRDGVAASSWTMADPTTGSRFMSANTGVTAGSTGTGNNHWLGSVTTDASGPTQATADKVRIRVNALGGAVYTGAVRVSVFYLQATAPTS